MTAGRWSFWIDRGGTFTDVVALRPDKRRAAIKLLSDDPEHYEDAAVEAIRRFLDLPPGQPIPAERIHVVKMGTTVATNALLERTGEPCVLCITRGLADALLIGDQTRPDLFALDIQRPPPVYARVIEVVERTTSDGQVLAPVDTEPLRRALAAARRAGLTSCAVVLAHGYAAPGSIHESTVADLARRAGFLHVSVSHQVSPLLGLVRRGDTTVVDATLTPVLRRYVDRVAAALGGAPLFFMQSNGGLTHAATFRGKDSILSGPAGGVVGAVRTAAEAGFDRIIGFDMGGTSTDVCHYRAGAPFERTFHTEVAGVRLAAPMLAVHTVAAGGGSVLHYDGARFRVGPDSAGAVPGPACYRRGGPLTITDCNVVLGRIQPDGFPRVFGGSADQPLDISASHTAFATLAQRVGRAPHEVAEGFLAVAVEDMARAIKRISIDRGHDVERYTLCAFGGAGGQHACLVADAIGIPTVLIHPDAGVLSAWGIGLAAQRALRERSLELPLLADLALDRARDVLDALAADALCELAAAGVDPAATTVDRRVHVRYQGTDTSLDVRFADADTIRAEFDAAHRARYGFVAPDRPLVLETATVEASYEPPPPGVRPALPAVSAAPVATVRLRSAGRWHDAPVLEREALAAGAAIEGPALLRERTGTTIIEDGWSATIDPLGHLVMRRHEERRARSGADAAVDPTRLTLFNHRFMSIAEQMGVTLEHTAHSVNIKERRDYSCAVFDGRGRLVANAPHIPVHLGSMGDTVAQILAARGGAMRPGDVYMLNDPYGGGTHLPDITVVTPVFDESGEELHFFVASRGHHADVGGLTPGSMPPGSRTIADEGILIRDFQVVRSGALRTSALEALFAPARNPAQNLADLAAQVAANERGVQQLRALVREFGLEVVLAYMDHIRENAAESVRRLLARLRGGRFECEMDEGCTIAVEVTVDAAARRARVDFTGTSAQQPSNVNAPRAVTKAVVLYVFRALCGEDIPLNAGCLEPLELVIPPGSMLDPAPPAAVVAGNVETSQVIADALLAALGAQAGSQGTMNNVTLGGDRYQYYETLCGGAGAGPDFDGASAVHTHMTNSRLTDPEVLEQRFPVLVAEFALRADSGGAGQRRGGDGVVRRLTFREPMTVAVLSNRRRLAPHGLAGGEPGQPGRNAIVRVATGASAELGHRAEVRVEAGDHLVVETPGGGGYGPAD